MPDALGYRLKCGVVIPSTGTVVEAELNRMAPPGVTIHAARMFIEQPSMASDASFEALLEQVRVALDVALRDVLTCEPDCVIMGISAETFWGSVEGDARFVERIKARWGIEIVSPASASRAALERLGVRRVALLNPYPPRVEQEVTRYFTECGFEVVGVKGLRLGHARAIADTPEAPLRKALREMDLSRADAIVQVGMNLPFARPADEAERWLDKPVLAIKLKKGGLERAPFTPDARSAPAEPWRSSITGRPVAQRRGVSWRRHLKRARRRSIIAVAHGRGSSEGKADERGGRGPRPARHAEARPSPDLRGGRARRHRSRPGDLASPRRLPSWSGDTWPADGRVRRRTQGSGKCDGTRSSSSSKAEIPSRRRSCSVTRS